MTIQPRFYPGSVDTHLHLHHIEARGIDVRSLLEQAAEAGMAALVDVGVESSDLDERRARWGEVALVRFTVGTHPTSLRPDTWPADRALLERVLDEAGRRGGRPGVVAIGETGLDFGRSADLRDLQLEALGVHAELARRYGLPLVLHNRRSEDAMLDFLERERPAGVMHCFSQDAGYCRSCVELGMHISFGGNLTYPGSAPIREAARIVPDEFLLVETDAPYLSPQPVRGRPNHPGHLSHVIDALAGIRGSTPEEVVAVTASNARRLFGLE